MCRCFFFYSPVFQPHSPEISPPRKQSRGSNLCAPFPLPKGSAPAHSVHSMGFIFITLRLTIRNHLAFSARPLLGERHHKSVICEYDLIFFFLLSSLNSLWLLQTQKTPKSSPFWLWRGHTHTQTVAYYFCKKFLHWQWQWLEVACRSVLCVPER